MISNQKGNVLFLILIAVVLFAALSYAVTQSSRGGGDVASDVAKLDASRILQWYGRVQNDYMKFSVLKSISYDDIRMSGGNGWTACSSGSDCLWVAEGGGVEYPQTYIDDLMNGSFAGVLDKYETGSSVAGFTAPHFLFFYLRSNIDRETLCQAYNDILGLGPYGASQNAYPGEPTACFAHSSGNFAIYFVFHSD